jgi:hypothetical protein
VLAQLVSVGSSTSKVPVRLPAHLAHPLSTESANALQALSLKANVSPVAVQVSLQSIVYASPATPTVPSVKVLFTPVLPAFPVITSVIALPLAFQLLSAPTGKSQPMESVDQFVLMVSCFLKAFAYTEVASADTKTMDSEGV